MSKAAPDSFESLLQAIFEDDRAAAKSLLKGESALAHQTVAEKDRYEPAIAHWLYLGDTALHAAAAGHRAEIARSLLEAGADVRSARNRRRSQPIHYASDGQMLHRRQAATRQVATMRLLVEAGADLHARDHNGATPLHRAVRTRCARAVRYLLEAGCDATLRNKPGSTPFHLAAQDTGRGGSGSATAREAQHDIISAFLEHQVSTAMTDSKGKSVLDWATSETIRQLLENKGGMRG